MVKLLIGMPAPALLSLTVKVTVGVFPAVPLVTLTRPKLRPPSSGAWSAMVCAPTMEASNDTAPCGMWQVAHCCRLACAPPAWLAPVAKLTLSWQEPHAAAPGVVIHALVCAAPFLGLWQVWQRSMLAGYTTVEKSFTAFEWPTI